MHSFSLSHLLLSLCLAFFATHCTKKRPHNSDHKDYVNPPATVSTSDDAMANLFLIDAFETDYSAYNIPHTSLALTETSPTPSASPSASASPTASPALSYGALRERAANMLFDIADQDSSATLTLEEFLTFHVMDISLPVDSAEKVRTWRASAFAAADGDNNKELSKPEALLMLDDLNTYVAKLRAQRQGDTASYASIYWQTLLNRYDADKNGKLDRAERKVVKANSASEFDNARTELNSFCAIAANEQNAECKSYELLKVVCGGAKLPSFIVTLCKRIAPVATVTATPTPTSSGTSTGTGN